MSLCGADMDLFFNIYLFFHLPRVKLFFFNLNLLTFIFVFFKTQY